MKLEDMESGIVIRADDKNAEIIITGHQEYISKLNKLSHDYPDIYKLIDTKTDIDGEVYYYKYVFPKKYINFGHPMSEESKEKLNQRLAKYRNG